MKKSPTIAGAAAGLFVGLIALAMLYFMAMSCLPYFVSYPDTTWPWYCIPTTYQKLVYFGFPMNVLSNDLASTVYYAPLTLLCYTLIGALLGRLFGRQA